MRSIFAASVLFFLLACGGAGPTRSETARKPDHAPDSYKVKLTTTKGDVVIEVTRAWAPRAADRFHELVNERYYDGARFFRVVKGFVVQWGLNGDPKVSQLWSQMKMPDDPVAESNKKGTVSFAMAGPASRTTQVFINLADNTRLDKSGFAPFGKVISGMEAVEEFYKGYGDFPPRGVGPDQNRILREGNAYLDRDFPRLDSIKTATVISP